MALSDIDRKLLQRCLSHKPRAWEDFVDRFLGLVVHVVSHTAQSRSIRLTSQDSEDLTAEVFLAIISNDLAVLRRFRGESSLATYLTVVARRVVVAELLKQKPAASLSDMNESAIHAPPVEPEHEERINNRDEIQQLLERLDGAEAEIVRLYHLEGKSYKEISSHVGMAENSIGPTLSRARSKMRRAGADTSSS